MLITHRIHLCPLLGRIIILGNLVDRKVRHVSRRLKLWLEWSADTAEIVPLHSTKERVSFDLLGAVLAALGANTVRNVAEHAVSYIRDQ